eukprot:5536423-Amphidinium_carterae.1
MAADKFSELRDCKTKQGGYMPMVALNMGRCARVEDAKHVVSCHANLLSEAIGKAGLDLGARYLAWDH